MDLGLRPGAGVGTGVSLSLEGSELPSSPFQGRKFPLELLVGRADDLPEVVLELF